MIREETMQKRIAKTLVPELYANMEPRCGGDAGGGEVTMVAATPLELGSSSVTVLRSGADFVVAAGLCGWLRAWQLRPAELTSEEVRTVSQQASTLTFYPLSPPEILIGAYHPFRRGCSYSTSAARTTCPTDARAPTRSGAPRWPNLSPP